MEDSDKRISTREIEKQLVKEIELLNEFDPDIELKKEFEEASLQDLQKHLDE